MLDLHHYSRKGERTWLEAVRSFQRSLEKAGRSYYQPDRDQIPNPSFWEICPCFGLLCVVWLRYKIVMNNMTVCSKASNTSENSHNRWYYFFICRHSSTNHKWSVYTGLAIQWEYVTECIFREHNFREWEWNGLWSEVQTDKCSKFWCGTKRRQNT